MNVLVACEYSGIVRDAFLKAGHNAFSCDILPTESTWPTKTQSSMRHFQRDIFDVLEMGYEWDLLIAHPPCTDLSVSGAWCYTKGFKPLWKKFDALAFVARLMAADVERICIENPVSMISGSIRKADQTIQPYQFGHPQSKKTCLWLKNLPLLEETENVYDDMMQLPPKERCPVLWMGGKDRQKKRSRFFEGIASAMAKQWGSLEN